MSSALRDVPRNFASRDNLAFLGFIDPGVRAHDLARFARAWRGPETLAAMNAAFLDGRAGPATQADHHESIFERDSLRPRGAPGLNEPVAAQARPMNGWADAYVAHNGGRTERVVGIPRWQRAGGRMPDRDIDETLAGAHQFESQMRRLD
jgi:hypothetical protein